MIIFLLVFLPNILALEPINVFLIPGQTYTVLPHRQLSISTFYTLCDFKDKSMQLINPLSIRTTLQFNKNQDLWVVEGRDSQQAYFQLAILNKSNILSIYDVFQHGTALVCQTQIQSQYDKLMFLGPRNLFLWSQEQFTFFDCISNTSINKQKFRQKKYRKCQAINSQSTICWWQNHTTLITLNDSQIHYRDIFDIQIPIYLIQNIQIINNIILVCSRLKCQLSIIDEVKITKIDQYQSVEQIIGSDSYQNQIVLLHDGSAVLLKVKYDPNLALQLVLQQSIDFPSQISCVMLSKLQLGNQGLIVQCSDFMAEQIKLVYIKDLKNNRYYPYNAVQLGVSSDCSLYYTRNTLGTFCNHKIQFRNNNFYIGLIQAQPAPQTVQLECGFIDSQQKIEQKYIFSVSQVEINQIYINKHIKQSYQIDYSSNFNIKLSYLFKASNIMEFVGISNCSFLGQTQASIISMRTYYSLFARQQIVQIIGGSDFSFYKLTMKNNTYLLQKCRQVQSYVWYICQLIKLFPDKLSLRIYYYSFNLVYFYLNERGLMLQILNKSRVVSESITQFEIKGEYIRAKRGKEYCWSGILNIIEGIYSWNCQDQFHTYHYSDSVYTIDKKGTIQNIQTDIQLPIYQLDQQYPIILQSNYLLLIINKTHINMYLLQSMPIFMYSLPYNQQSINVQRFTLTGYFLLIQYQLDSFQLYDCRMEALAARIISYTEQTIGTILVIQEDIILIPLKNQPMFVTLNLDQSIVIGDFSVQRNRFKEECKFTLAPVIDNGSCPFINDSSLVHQNFTLKINYDTREIQLGTQILSISVPYTTQGFIYQIDEYSYLGPIFMYQLNNDYYGMFQLSSHLTLQECQQLNLYPLYRQNNIQSEQLVVTSKNKIYLVDYQFNTKVVKPLRQGLYCQSYLKIGNTWVIVCDFYFISFTNTSTPTYSPHIFHLEDNKGSQLNVQAHYINIQKSYRIIVMQKGHRLLGYIMIQGETFIKYTFQYCLGIPVNDIKIVNNIALVLIQSRLCLFPFKLLQESNAELSGCMQINEFVNNRFGLRKQYTSIIPFYYNNSTIRFFMFSKTSDSLHLQIEININGKPRPYILNAYSGYKGYDFEEVIGIRANKQGYSHFLLLYSSNNKKNQRMMGFYLYNKRYKLDGTIQQIKSAIIYEDHFNDPFKVKSFVFSTKIYLVQQQHNNQKYIVDCLKISVRDALLLIMKYEQPPPIKFIILKAQNKQIINSQYIRLNFQKEQINILSLSLGFLGLVLFFLALGFCVKKLKDQPQEQKVYFISQEIQPHEHLINQSAQTSSIVFSNDTSSMTSYDS